MNGELPLLAGSRQALLGLSGEDAEFVTARRALTGLTAQLACRTLEGWPHSVAEVLAHLVFWQDFALRVIEGGQALPDVSGEDHGWPRAGAGDWERLVETYLTGQDRLRAILETADLTRVVRRHHTLGYRIESHLGHEAYHLGQIVFMRRVLGAWPPGEEA